jgi:hypothetical protein
LEKKDEESVIQERIEKAKHMQHQLDKKLENVLSFFSLALLSLFSLPLSFPSRILD